MQNEHDVFISYSHKDKKVADAICTNLELNGIKCWYAPRNIVSGEDWASSIVKAIGKAKIFVLVFSEYSNGSEQVMNEVSAAFNAGCVVIPFKIKDIDMSAGLYYYLNRVHWFDAVSLPLEKNINQLCEQIKPLIIEPQSNFKSAPEPVSAPKPEPHDDNLKNKKMVPAAALAVVFVLVLLGLLLKKPAQSEDTLADASETETVEAAASVGKYANILMMDTCDKNEDGEYQGTVFGSEISRDDIVTVTFTDKLEGMPDETYDVSVNADGTVKAWTVVHEGGSGYDLIIAAAGGIKGDDCSGMFAGYHNVRSIQFNNSFDMSDVQNMEHMFDECRNLSELDLSGIDTSKATNMAYMFRGCNKLKEIDVSGFQTENVTNMMYMFYDCQGLTRLDLSNFATENVTDMGFMFSDCTNLTELDVSSFKTDNVKSMYAMFQSCEKLTKLDLSNFNTKEVTNMSYMFSRCIVLEALDISGFKTDNVTSMKDMFQACENLTSLDVSGFKTNNVKDMKGMFNHCKSLTSLDVSGFDMSSIENLENQSYTEYMFSNCGITAEEAGLKVE